MVESVDEYIEIWSRGTGESFRVDVPDSVAEEIIENHPEYKRDLAGNKTISKRILRRLSKDADLEIREDVARTRRTPPDVLVELAGDPEEWVRANVSTNAKAPIEALELLVDDPIDYIRKDARRSLAEKREKADSDGES